MNLNYPENTVCYITARSTAILTADPEPDNCGSGVVVCLRKKGQSNSGQRYVLTCEHVIRGRSTDGADGYGRLLNKIQVWPAGEGFAPQAASTAHVAQDLKSVNSDDIPMKARVAVNDWVLLEVDDATFTKSAMAVSDFVEPTSGKLSIIGYPGGSSGFNRHTVTPTPSDPVRFKDHHNRLVRLHGDETRPGMSGGGLFDKTGGLVGIHRARSDSTLQSHSLSATYIKEVLDAAGYEVVQFSHIPPTNVRRKLIVGAVVGVAAAGSGIVWWTSPTLPWNAGTKQLKAYSGRQLHVPLVFPFTESSIEMSKPEHGTLEYDESSNQITYTANEKALGPNELTAKDQFAYWPAGGTDVEKSVVKIVIHQRFEISVQEFIDKLLNATNLSAWSAPESRPEIVLTDATISDATSQSSDSRPYYEIGFPHPIETDDEPTVYQEHPQTKKRVSSQHRIKLYTPQVNQGLINKSVTISGSVSEITPFRYTWDERLEPRRNALIVHLTGEIQQ